MPVAVKILLLEPLVIKSDTSTEIASAATSIPVPAPIFRVLLAANVPPPVKPFPAIIDLPSNPATSTPSTVPPTVIFPPTVIASVKILLHLKPVVPNELTLSVFGLKSTPLATSTALPFTKNLNCHVLFDPK